MQLSHHMTSLEVIHQMTCSFFWSHKRLYIIFFQCCRHIFFNQETFLFFWLIRNQEMTAPPLISQRCFPSDSSCDLYMAPCASFAFLRYLVIGAQGLKISLYVSLQHVSTICKGTEALPKHLFLPCLGAAPVSFLTVRSGRKETGRDWNY